MTETPLYKRYPSLFHYTNAAGLDGILKSQTLWATHYTGLNDARETKASHDRQQKIIFDALMKSYQDELCKGNCELERQLSLQQISPETYLSNIAHQWTILNEFKDAPFHGPFMVSFNAVSWEWLNSEDETLRNMAQHEFNHGLLSQWRGYGMREGGGGYCIEFDTRPLEEFAKGHISESMFDAVVYDFGDAAIFGRLGNLYNQLQKYSSALVPHLHNNFSALSDDILLDFMKATLPIICLTKDPAFYEEKEVRLFKLVYRDSHDEPIFTRIKGGKIVSYIELFKGQTLPVKRIIVGPHAEQDSRVKSLEILLSHLNRPIDVCASKIPYIG